MANKRITQNTAILYNQVQATDVLLIGKTAVDRKITLPQTKKYVLQNKAIGGGNGGDIPTNDSTGSFYNKQFIYPVINGGDQLQATSTDLNKLLNTDTTQVQFNLIHGLTIPGTTLNNLSGISGNVQQQLNNKITRYGTTQKVQYGYSKITTASSDITCSYRQILTYLGLSPTWYRVDGSYLLLQTFQIASNGTRTNVNPSVTTQYTVTTDGIKTNLDTVKISGLVSGKQYQVNISVKLNTYSGEA